MPVVICLPGTAMYASLSVGETEIRATRQNFEAELGADYPDTLTYKRILAAGER